MSKSKFRQDDIAHITTQSFWGRRIVFHVSINLKRCSRRDNQLLLGICLPVYQL